VDLEHTVRNEQLLGDIRPTRRIWYLTKNGAAAAIARLFLPPPRSEKIGLFIRTGNGFPQIYETRFRRFGLTVEIRRELDKQCASAHLEYEEALLDRKLNIPASCRLLTLH
jgi:hypothetical protein